MKGFLNEFKAFIARGNVMDLAVGMIIGSAFSAIVTSLVDDIINPILGCFGGMNFTDMKLPLVGEATLNYGNFITAIINFLIMAFVIFLIVKAMNKVTNSLKKPEAPAAPTTKKCDYCMSEIDIKATRCPHCTSQLVLKK